MAFGFHLIVPATASLILLNSTFIKNKIKKLKDEVREDRKGQDEKVIEQILRGVVLMFLKNELIGEILKNLNVSQLILSTFELVESIKDEKIYQKIKKHTTDYDLCEEIYKSNN
jgi:hypoxanthine-guanine phosphoribosyltransferase